MLIVVCCLLLLQLCLSVTVLQVNETKAVERITTLIVDLSNDMPRVIRNPAAKLVRLSFHDCVGGCDGCINLNNPDNNGLQEIFQRVNAIYENEGYNTTGMSRADFIALAGTAAIRQASSLQTCNRLNLPPGCDIPIPNISIKYGRIDCSTSPSTSIMNEFPNPHKGLDHVLEVFRDGMSMTVNETVAILGAHTLGDAGITRSGFRGPWVPQTAVFDNMFYRQLRAPNWFQEEINDVNSSVYPASRYQWTLERGMGPGPMMMAGPNLLMLNTDVAVWKEINPDDTGVEENETCRDNLDNCDPSSTADIVTQFANDNVVFHNVFATAYQKLVENGYTANELITAQLANDTNTTMSPDSSIRHTSSIIVVIIAIVVFAFC